MTFERALTLLKQGNKIQLPHSPKQYLAIDRGKLLVHHASWPAPEAPARHDYEAHSMDLLSGLWRVYGEDPRDVIDLSKLQGKIRLDPDTGLWELHLPDLMFCSENLQTVLRVAVSEAEAA